MKKVLAACGAVLLLLAVGASLLVVLTLVRVRRDLRETKELLDELKGYQLKEDGQSPPPTSPAGETGKRGLP